MSNDDLGDNFSLAPVHVPKAADILADRLRAQILSGALPAGKQLPTERELSERTNLSRASVREALRILGVEGLITTKPGRGGGSAIRVPTPEELQRSISLFVRSRQFPVESLLEAREVIEPAVSRLAAKNRTAKDLELLQRAQQALVDNQHDQPAFVRANLEWHLAVARASHNEILLAFMNAIANVILSHTAIDAFDSPEVRAANIHAHEQVMRALVEGDGDSAARRMTRHVHAAGETAEAALARSAGAPAEPARGKKPRSRT